MLNIFIYYWKIRRIGNFGFIFIMLLIDCSRKYIFFSRCFINFIVCEVFLGMCDYGFSIVVVIRDLVIYFIVYKI